MRLRDGSLIAQALLATAAVLIVPAMGPAAQATFSGHNGEIAYLDMEGVYSDSDTVTTLVQVCASGFHERDFLSGRWDTGTVAFSPDGHTVATSGISIAAVTGKWERRLSRPPRRAVDFGPVWSPNGGALAFTREHHGSGNTIRSMAIRIYEKGHGRFLAQGFSPAWSVRNQIAFVRGQSYESSTQEVYVASLRSGAVRHLITGYAPRWSPDGRRLLFSYEAQDPASGTATQEIATINGDGSGLHTLASGSGASWSPNGRWIGFHDPAGYVAVIASSGGAPRRLAHSNSAPLFSPDSRWVAYTWTPDYELYIVPVKGGSRRFVTSSSEEMELLDWRAARASETRC
jgi:Tol biopolymer transport system component